jgi:hypothetical protein
VANSQVSGSAAEAGSQAWGSSSTSWYWPFFQVQSRRTARISEFAADHRLAVVIDHDGVDLQRLALLDEQALGCGARGKGRTGAPAWWRRSTRPGG